ncbi:MAG: hypothetical protein IPL64_06550 [Flavobacteriales bacterium]|nr:hypothetical protein [Flavobacteriales bacterium]
MDRAVQAITELLPRVVVQACNVRDRVPGGKEYIRESTTGNQGAIERLQRVDRSIQLLSHLDPGGTT